MHTAQTVPSIPRPAPSSATVAQENSGGDPVRLTQEAYAEMAAHAQREAPIEACGYLAKDAEGRICAAFPMTNADKAEDHYTLDPAEQFAVVKAIRSQGLRLAGVYHSHPASPARPSPEDIRLAHDPDLLYLIVTLLPGEEKPVRAFRIRKQTVTELDLVVEGASLPGGSSSMSGAPAQEDKTAATIHRAIDLHGVGCPMNLVKVKVALAAIEPGQHLEVVLDDGPPIRNVPQSVEKEGHAILERRQLPDGAWRLVIRKHQ